MDETVESSKVGWLETKSVVKWAVSMEVTMVDMMELVRVQKTVVLTVEMKVELRDQ